MLKWAALLAILGVGGMIIAGRMGINKKEASELEQSATTMWTRTKEAAGNFSVAGKVKAVLSWRKGISGGDLEVSSAGSVVTIKGKAKDAAQKKLILDLANNVEGVEKVVDEIKVAAPMP